MASFVSFGLPPLVVAEAVRSAKVRFSISTIPAQSGVWFDVKGEIFVPELTSTERAILDSSEDMTADSYWQSLGTLTDNDYILGEIECCVLDITDLSADVAAIRENNEDFADVLASSGIAPGHRALVVGQAMTRSQFRGNKLLNLMIDEVELMFKPSITLLEALPILPSSERAYRRGYGRDYARAPDVDQQRLIGYYETLGFSSSPHRPSIMGRVPSVPIDTSPITVPSSAASYEAGDIPSFSPPSASEAIVETDDPPVTPDMPPDFIIDYVREPAVNYPLPAGNSEDGYYSHFDGDETSPDGSPHHQQQAQPAPFIDFLNPAPGQITANHQDEPVVREQKPKSNKRRPSDDVGMWSEMNI